MGNQNCQDLSRDGMGEEMVWGWGDGMGTAEARDYRGKNVSRMPVRWVA